MQPPFAPEPPPAEDRPGLPEPYQPSPAYPAVQPYPMPQPYPAQPYHGAYAYPVAQPDPPRVAPRRHFSAWVIVAAGGTAIIGAFLPWASLTVPFLGTRTVTGIDGWAGWVVVAVGLALVAYGVSIQRGVRPPALVSAVAALGALGLMGYAITKTAQAESGAADIRAELSGPLEDDVFGIGRALSDVVAVDVGAGLRLITLGGLAAVVAVVVGMQQDR